MNKPIVTMDQHMLAIDWLEVNLEDPISRFDIDDLIALVEQVTALRFLRAPIFQTPWVVL